MPPTLIDEPSLDAGRERAVAEDGRRGAEVLVVNGEGAGAEHVELAVDRQLTGGGRRGRACTTSSIEVLLPFCPNTKKTALAPVFAVGARDPPSRSVLPPFE